MTHEAIYQLYPTVKEIFESEDGVFTCLDANKNEVEINMSEVSVKATELQTAEDAKVNQKATDKANGNQKLLDLGLTQAEATALTGYTPPVAE